jgi:hypothetical protein
LCAWAHAFREVNAAALDTLYQNLKQELNKLSAKQARVNGLHLRTVSPKVWLFRYCSIQYMRCGERADPRHFDGGAALLICAMTLWGERTLSVERKKNKKDWQCRRMTYLVIPIGPR